MALNYCDQCGRTSMPGHCTESHCMSSVFPIVFRVWESQHRRGSRCFAEMLHRSDSDFVLRDHTRCVLQALCIPPQHKARSVSRTFHVPSHTEPHWSHDPLPPSLSPRTTFLQCRTSIVTSRLTRSVVHLLHNLLHREIRWSRITCCLLLT